MARNRQTARKSAGGQSSKHMVVKRQHIDVEDRDWRWVYLMIRLIDIEQYILEDPPSYSAEAILVRLCKMDDVYNIINLENEFEVGNHILVGVEARHTHPTRRDAYILIGFRIIDNEVVEYTNELINNINRVVCDEPMDILTEHIRFINDEDELVWLMGIIKDMEDFADEGSVEDVIMG